MTVLETVTSYHEPEVLVEIEISVYMKTTENGENLSMEVQEKAINDDDPDIPVKQEISDTGTTREVELAEISDKNAIEEVELQYNHTSEGEETEARKEGFDSDSIDKPIVVTSIPDDLHSLITKEIINNHDPVGETMDQMETDIIDTAIDAREFPYAFYDPNTKELMIDPVVIPNGNSYERSTITRQQGDDIESEYKLYANRALITVINETAKLSGDSVEAGMRLLSKSIQNKMEQLISNNVFQPLSDAYYCPITFDLIHFPVIDAEGYTFEKVAIEAWIEKNGKSPITRTPLSKEELYNNHAITALLEEEKGKSVENMHPSIRKFIDTDPPVAPQYRNTSTVEINNFPNTPEDLEVRRLSMRTHNLIYPIVLFMILLLTMVIFHVQQWFFLFLILGFMIYLIYNRLKVADDMNSIAIIRT